MCARGDDGKQVYNKGDSGGADSDEDEGVVFLKKCEAPSPEVWVRDLRSRRWIRQLIPDKDANKLYVLLCCDSLDWKLGTIVKFKPRAKKFNLRSSGAPPSSISSYFFRRITTTTRVLLPCQVTVSPVSGDWVYF